MNCMQPHLQQLQRLGLLCGAAHLRRATRLAVMMPQQVGRLAAGSSKSFWDVNWAYLGTAANILVSGTLHRLLPRVWAAPAMLVGTS
jgi:hypothetical protein